MKLTTVCALLICFSGVTFGQEDYGPPAAIARGLQTADRKAQLKVAGWLRLEHVAPQLDFRECDIRIDDVRLDDKGDTTVMQVRCGHDLNIVGLRRHGPLTEHLDTRYFYAAYDSTRVEFVSLLQPSFHEIAIHNAATVSGNLYHAYLVVLRLVGGRLQSSFSILETATEPRYGAIPRSLKSTITLTSASPEGSGAISQVATVQIGKRSHIIRRSYGWSEDLKSFVEAEVQSVEANK